MSSDSKTSHDTSAVSHGKNEETGSLSFNNHYPLHQATPISMSQALVNSYQLYIQSPPTNHIPMYYDNGVDNSSSKKRRTNYKNPENSAKLSAAINMLLNQQAEDSNGQRDLKSISKMFNIPYNTLRDNYLRVTTGKAPKSKRDRKPEASQQQQPKHLHPLLYASKAPPSAGELTMMMHAPPPLYGDPSLQHLHYMQQLYAGMPPHFGQFQHPPNSASRHAVMDPARQLLNATYHSSGCGDQLRSPFFQPQLQQFHQLQGVPVSSSALKRPLSGGDDSDSEENSDEDEEERMKRGKAVDGKHKKGKDAQKSDK